MTQNADPQAIPDNEYTRAKARVKAEAERGRVIRQPSTPAGDAALERRIVAQAQHGRDLRGGWSQMARFDAEPAEIDHRRYAESLEAVRDNQNRLVERAHQALATERTTPTPTRPGAAPPAPRQGGWEALVRRGVAEAANVRIGERDRQLDVLDPDSTQAESRALGTADAVTVARYRGH
jgi:hypothetical protein